MTMLERLLAEATARFDLVDADAGEDSFRDAVLSGLRKEPKSIPPRFLYDSRGSALFDQICALPEYYLTRAETEILNAHAAEIAERIGPNAFLIELGSGASVKTRILLDALDRPAAYAPIDVSREHLRFAASAIALDYPGLKVTAISGDYGGRFELPDFGSRRIAFFPGSTIGNLDRSEALSLLRRWRSRLGSSGMMIIGADLKKDRATVEAAYNDAAGVTERFIKNILVRANRELGADFNPRRFGYEARYVEQRSRVEMRLRSVEDQTVFVDGAEFFFAAGEAIEVETSRKYSQADLEALAAETGFAPEAFLLDRAGAFTVHIWRAQNR